MTPEQLKQLLAEYAKTCFDGGKANPAEAHILAGRKSALESQILSLFVEAEEGARRERAEWMDIETAPKDGTTILLYLPDEPEWTRFSVAAWSEHSKVWYGISPSASGTLCRSQPTHWQPLPSPPDEAIRAKVELEG